MLLFPLITMIVILIIRVFLEMLSQSKFHALAADHLGESETRQAEYFPSGPSIPPLPPKNKTHISDKSKRNIQTTRRERELTSL